MCRTPDRNSPERAILASIWSVWVPSQQISVQQKCILPARAHLIGCWLVLQPSTFSVTFLFFVFPTSAVFVAATSARSCFGSISVPPLARRGSASLDRLARLASIPPKSLRRWPKWIWPPPRSSGPLLAPADCRLFFSFFLGKYDLQWSPPLNLSATSLRARPPALLSHCLIFCFSHPLPVLLHINLSRSPSLASSHLLFCGQYHC